MASGRWKTWLAATVGALALAGPALADPDPKLVAADALFQAGKFKEAAAEVEAILKAAELSKDPIRIADAAGELGAIRVAQGDLAGAEPLLLRAIELRRKALGPNHPDTIGAETQYAAWLTFQGRDREAEPILARTAAALEAGAKTPEQKADAAEARGGHAMVLFNLGRWTEAETEMKASLAVLEDPAIPQRPTLMAFLTVLSDGYLRWGRYAEAQAAAEKALALREARQGPNHPDVVGTLNKLALIRLTVGDEGGAEALYKRELAIAEVAYPEGPLRAHAVEDLAEFYSVSGRPEQALPLFERALALRAKAKDRPHRLAETWRQISLAKLRAGDGPGADEAAGKALELYQTAFGPDAEEVGTAKLTAARVKFAIGDNVSGEAFAKEGLAIYRKALSPDNPRLGDALFLVGFGAQRRRDRDAAEMLYGEALDVMLGRRPDSHEAVINSRTSLAQQVLLGKKDPKRAFETVELAADSLRVKILANARLLGREGAPTLSVSDRNVFFVTVRTAWAYSESLKAAEGPAPAKP